MSSSTTQLTDEQVAAAMKENVIKFPKVERLPIDPPISNQNFALMSFKMLPSPVGGVYGFMKCRGTFATEDQCDKHSQMIIRGVDSKHKIWPFEVGKWLPITNNEDYAKETLEVSQQNELKKIYNNQESNEEKQVKQSVKDIKSREQKLRDECMKKETDVNTLDYYAQQVMKQEQLVTWLDQIRQRKRQMLKALQASESEIKRLNESNPDYPVQVVDRIREIKTEIGLDPNASLTEPSAAP